MAEAKKRQAIARRVIRQGSKYICGMCGSTYRFPKRAEDCVERCFRNQISDDKVDEESGVKKKKYRCRYCKRVYNNVDEAKDCVKSCKSKVLQQRDKEKSSVNNSLAALANRAKNLALLSKNISTQAQQQRDRQGSKIARKGNSYICKICNSLYPNARDAQLCSSRHNFRSPESYAERVAKAKNIALVKRNNLLRAPQQKISVKSSQQNRDNAVKSVIKPVQAVSPVEEKKYTCSSCNMSYPSEDEMEQCLKGHEQEQSQSHEGDAEQDKSIVYKLAADAGIPDKKKFLRDGAKYVCKKCNNKYYTRMEVVECFNYDCPEILPTAAGFPPE